MTTVAEVRLWGRTIGAVALDDGETFATFQYNPEFVGSGIELSPIKMPLNRRPYRFPDLPRETFYGLPGMVADSLPDKFGNALIDAWLDAQGRPPESLNAVERLCYVGPRAMGALEYHPSKRELDSDVPLDISHLVELANRVLQQREGFATTLEDEEGLADILRVGTSAGGARAKAVIAWNRDTGEVRSGQVDADEGFEHWLLKFDGISHNRDRELVDPQGFGLIELAYARMAQEAGIEMTECRIFEEQGRHHFMTRRFDRLADGDKLHMQSLGAMAHFDYNAPGAHSYEQCFTVIRKLGMSTEVMEQQFRRMAFNIIARNQDDHVKNIAFLMDKKGRWSLSPAFDLTYSYNPQGAWTSTHQMSMNGKRADFTVQDFVACGRKASLKRGRPKAIVKEICQVVRRWPQFAEEAGVFSSHIRDIERNFRVDIS